VFFGQRYYATEAGHRNIDALTLRIPALGRRHAQGLGRPASRARSAR